MSRIDISLSADYFLSFMFCGKAKGPEDSMPIIYLNPPSALLMQLFLRKSRKVLSVAITVQVKGSTVIP